MATCTKRNNSYLIRSSAGFDEGGSRIRKSVTWTPPAGMSQAQIKKELQRKMAEFDEAVENDQLPDDNMTFADFAEKWLAEYAVHQLKAKTLNNYTNMLHDRIIPAIGHLKLRQIAPKHLLAFYSNLGEAGVKKAESFKAKPELKKYVKRNKITYEKVCELSHLSYNTVRTTMNCLSVSGKTANAIASGLGIDLLKYFIPGNRRNVLSNKTIQYYHQIISSVLSSAVQWQMLKANPCERVKPPKSRYKEAPYLEAEDAIRLMRCLQNEELIFKLLISLYLFTGMRRGEALGLKWCDVDFKKNIVDINKELIYIPKKGVILDTPKNETSVRKVSLTEEIMELFREWKKEQRRNIALYGDLYELSDFVFTNQLGKPFHPDTISKWFSDFIKKNDLPPIHIHSLRHTNASMLIASGVDIKTVSSRLGHASIQTTGVIYTHQLRSADETAAQILASVLFEHKTDGEENKTE